MADERHVLEVDVVDKATSKLHSIANGLDSMGSAAGASEKHLATIDRRLPKMASELRQTAKSMETFRDATKGMGAQTSAEVLRAQAALTRLTSWAPRKNGAFSSVQDATNLDQLASFQREYSSALNALNGVVAKNTGLTDTNTGATVAATAAAAAHTQGLNATRYAMYDVSMTLGILGAGLVAVSALTYKASIDWERDFAHVVRTTGVAGSAVETLRNEFISLQQEIPVTSSDLATIGTLAAQMGIAAQDVAGFTRITAMFSATAGTSVDETATALSRLDSLLPDIEGNYNRLASTILKTGVNAVATEQQIIRSVNQIASISRIAGLTTPEVVALSSALSSLGMSPELQRSVITSSFSKLLTVTGNVTAATDKYGKVLGMTGQQFANAFKSDAYGTYSKFLEAIANSEGAVATLQDLGLASQRLTPNLLKIGQNTALLRQTLSDTNSEWKVGTELTRQYDVIAETMSAKLTRLANSFQGLLVTVGDGGAIFGGLVDVGLDLLKMLTDIASNPVGNFFLQLGIVVAGVVGVLSLMGAASAASYAGILGVQSAIVGLTGSTAAVTPGLAGLVAQLTAVGGASGRTAAMVAGLSVAARGLLTVVKLLSVALAGFALVSVDGEIQKFSNATKGFDSDIAALSSRLRTLRQSADFDLGVFNSFNYDGFESLTGMTDSMIAAQRGLGGFSSSVMGDIRLLDEQLASLAETDPSAVSDELDRLRASWTKAGLEASSFDTAFTDSTKAITAGASALGDAAAAAIELAAAEEAAAAAADKVASRLNVEDLEAYVAAVNKGAAAWFDYKSNLEAAYAVDDPTTDANEAGGGISQFASTLDSQIKDMTAWADDLARLSSMGMTGIAQVFAAEGPGSRQALADALTLGPEQLAQLDANARLAAFLSSEAYAEQFASDNAMLAGVYAQTGGTWGLQAVNGVIAAMRDGMSSAEWLALSQQYGFDIPLEADVSPAEASAAQFRYAQEQIPTTLRAIMELDGAEAQMSAFLNAQRIINVRVNAVYSDSTGRYIGSGPGMDAGATGGYVTPGGITMRGYADGGLLRGPGTGTSDSIPAWLSNGEFIMNAASVRHYGAQFFDQINRRQMPRFAQGGMVDGSSSVGAGGNVTNVSVVQNYPTTRDPIKTLREDSENLAAGSWSS